MLQDLAYKLKNASQPVTINAALITSAGLTPPTDFDANLKAAFLPPGSTADFKITFNAHDVGSVSGVSGEPQRFQISNVAGIVRLGQNFLNAAPSQTDCVLTFTQDGESSPLQIQIEVALSGWKFTDYFTFMNGFPFSLLQFSQQSFVFSTVDSAAYQVRNVNQMISLDAGQNYVASFSVPPDFNSLFSLISGFTPPASALIFGSIVLDKADNANILYPDMDLRAPLASGQVTLLGFMPVSSPFIGLQIKTVQETTDEDGNEFAADDDPQYFQTPFLYLGVYLQVTNIDNKTLTLDFVAGKNISDSGFGFSLNVDPNSAFQLTPAAVIGLMVNQSYFSLIPAELQQFLTQVGLLGFSVNGTIKPAAVSSLAISLGSVSVPDNPSSPIRFQDPSNNQWFKLDSFNLDWIILNPLPFSPTTSTQLITVSSSFVIFPTVFKGVFDVSIDQNLNLDGDFKGTVGFNDLLNAVTNGYIGLPNGVDVTFSDITFQLNPKVKTYSFALTLDAEVDIISPMIQFQNFHVQLAATTPTASSGSANGNNGNGNNGKPATVYNASINGFINIGEATDAQGKTSPAVSLNASVDFDGTKTPSVWTLKTSLAQPLSITQLINQFFAAFDIKNFPNFLPGDLTVETFSIEATIPSKSKTSQNLLTDGTREILLADENAAQPVYQVAGKLEWILKDLPFGAGGTDITITADIGLKYDGNQPDGQKFSGSVIGDLNIADIGADVTVGYSFGPEKSSGKKLLAAGDLSSVEFLAEATPGNSQTLWVQWNGIRADYKFADKTLTFRLTGWTVGKLIQELMRMIGDPYFTLDSPWDLLNQISLDGLSVTFDFKAKAAGTSWIRANYSLPSPIDLGFMKINGIVFQRTSDGKVTIAIDGSIGDPKLKDSPLFKPDGPGQDVKKMPGVTGRGNAYFDVRMLALGQRVGINGFQNFNSVDDVFKALEKVPSTQGADSNPVNPSSPTAGQPFYNPNNNWLIAADFGLIRVPGSTSVYTFDCKVVFNDPNLYGLRLALNGEKAKALAGLVIDILYKKISDDVGVYQIDFSFPSIIRNLNFGAFNIILPDIGIQIYTNGDFFFDFGFPYNLDFSRSFTVQAIILGVPVTGSAGFYFGKLSSATATQVPKTTKGSFNPVIVFGFGVQVGVGYDINKGPLKAGFSITVFGIIEGVIAPFHPYQITDGGGEVQSDYYFKLQGTIGLIGKLYGSIDFVIIKADVELLVQVYAQATYESYHAIPLTLSAHVSVKVSLKIDLGLFSISISFSFAMTITESVTIGHDELENAPWYDGSSHFLKASRRPLRHTRASFMLLREPPPELNFRAFERPAAAVNPTLTITVAPQFTVHQADVTDANPAHQQGAFVLLLAMDAPTADGSGAQTGSSFESLCRDFLPWVVDALKSSNSATARPLDDADEPVTIDELKNIMKRLADTSSPAITADDVITKFLQPNFTLNIALPAQENQDALQKGATIFPPLTGFSVKYPNPNGDGSSLNIAFDNYVTITEDYRENMAAELDKLAAQVNSETGSPAPKVNSAENTDEPFARYIFEDYFLLIARQLVQSSLDALDDFAYALTAKPANPAPGDTTDSLATILSWLQNRGNDNIQLSDIAAPNLTHPLTGGNNLVLPGINYTVQQSDTLQSIAARYSDSANARWQTTPANLIIQNQSLNTLILPGVTITAGTGTEYTTQIGDSFAGVAAALKVTIQQLAAETSLYQIKNLLASSIQIVIPDINYTTAGGDTLQGIMTSFAVSLAAILANETNVNCPYLFDASSATISVAHLESLNMSDFWSFIQKKNQVGQTAGMLARYQLHGMRLPNLAGLKLPGNFAYPTQNAQPDYGLFQLTGQQFPTPQFPQPPFANDFSYSISLEKDSTLSWVEFNGDVKNTELAIPLSANSPGGNASQAEQLYYLLQYAKGGAFDPNPTLTIQPDATVNPRRQSVRSATNWSTSDQQKLVSITAPPADLSENFLTTAAQQPQTQPILWELPDGILSDAENREANLLANSAFNPTEINKYLPVYQPTVGTTDPATYVTTFAPIQNYAFSTRIDFQIKKLAQQDDLAPQTPLANDVVPPDSGISGSPAKNLAPFTYELVGPNPSDALLLERLLTAMNSTTGGLGEDIISGLFILYPDSAVAASGLVSRADAEFLSFISQTNLSTETNPPPSAFAGFADAADKKLDGIINSPSDFIKMMWELSTVRSGGYYLYYEVIGQGAGLPDALFNDSGVATLTLAITYSRNGEPANGGRIANFVNSFVTTDAIDVQRSVLTLESQSEQAQTNPLAGTESLQDISNLYGVEVGLLAQLNSQIQVPNNVQLPISGVAHRITPADLALSGDVLTNLATYYSKGAQSPITAADIGGFNPGVKPALYSVFRIPPIVYVASAANAGNTFASMRDYYGLSINALADLARGVSGIFAKNQTLTVDSISRDVQPALGTGNIGVALTRANLGAPPDLPASPNQNQIQAFASAYMFSLYTLLTAGLYGNAFFKSSQPGVPFGPRKPLSQEEGSALRHAESRRQLLHAQAEEDLQYSQTIGFVAGQFSLVNPAPNPTNALLPPQSANPYVGIGTTAQVNLQWADIFGNRTVTPFTNPSANYGGALNNVPIEIDYVDRLIGLERWSNVRTYYTYSGTPANAQMVLNFTMQTCAYQPSTNPKDPRNQMTTDPRNPNGPEIPVWQATAVNDQKRFTDIYFQLNQNYDGLNVPGLSGQAVSLSLINTLLKNEKTALSASDAQSVRDFVSACLIYVTNRANAQDGGAQPICQLQIPLALNQISDSDVIELSLSLSLERQKALCDASLRVIEGGTSAATVISPLMEVPQTGVDCNNTNPTAPSQNIGIFADAFEGVFLTGDWQMRVGTSAPDPSQPRGKQTSAVWAVRMGKKPNVGFHYEIQNQASFYAPKPVAKTLQTAIVSIGKYSTGSKFPGSSAKMTFTGVDLNAWANSALAAIDTFLAPGFATPAFIVDSLLNDKPEKDGYVAKILKCKEKLSNAIAATVVPILQTSADDEISLAAAQEKLRQSLLNRLSNAFITTAVTVFSVSNVSVNPQNPNEVSPSRFYGQPQKYEAPTETGIADSASGTAEQNYSLTTGKIQYFKSLSGQGDWRLPFLFSSKNVKEQTYVSLPLAYALTHLECGITNVPGIENYEQSTWIQLVNAPFITQIGEAETEFPVVLRALPTPPSMTAQTANSDAVSQGANASEMSPSDLAFWDYELDYSYNNSAQDSVTAVLTLNWQGDLVSAEDDESPLFAPLAQFVTIYGEILTDFETYLRKVNASSKLMDTDVINAQYALDAFEQIVDAVATAYDKWANPPQADLMGEALSQVTCTFDIVLESGTDGNARIDVLNWNVSGTTQTMPTPVIKLESYTAVLAPDKPADALVSYNYTSESPTPDAAPGATTFLSYDKALTISDRAIVLNKLNVFTLQNALGQLQIVRNEYLLSEQTGVRTSGDFEFSTPQVKFANSAIPSLNYTNFDLSTLQVDKPALASYLNAFFASLLQDAAGLSIMVKMTASFSYQLAASLPDFPRTSLPIALLPPQDVTPEKGVPLPVVAPFASAISEWAKANNPVLNPSSEYNIGLEIFAGESSDSALQMPLLSISNLFIDATKIQFD
jgi:LysM repeat protein